MHYTKPSMNLDIKDRLCLGCLKTFKSEHIGNRQCAECKRAEFRQDQRRTVREGNMDSAHKLRRQYLDISL